MSDVQLADSTGDVRLLNVVNSLDTPVCHVETHRWEQLRRELPEGARVYTISMDLPIGQARWRHAEGVEHETPSAHADVGFGVACGVLLKKWRLLKRAVFVIDGDGTVVHAEYVADQMTEPGYDVIALATSPKNLRCRPSLMLGSTPRRAQSLTVGRGMCSSSATSSVGSSSSRLLTLASICPHTC
jgi:thiol peroxidase